MTCFHIVESENQVVELFAKNAEIALFHYISYISNAAMFELEKTTFQYSADNSVVVGGIATFTNKVCVISQIAPQVYCAAWKSK